MEKIDRAAEAFSKLKVDNSKELVTRELLEKFIDSRDNLIWKHKEELNEHIKIFNSNSNINYQNVQYLDNRIKELQEQVDKLTQQRERFQHNLMYVEVVEDVITNKETEWENKTFNNMVVKLVGKDEVYKVFVQTSNAPVIGSKIKFTFNADENKLSQVKLINQSENI